jgi:hypothetical protein
MKKFVLAIAISLSSFSAFADNVWLHSTIKRVYPLADGSFVLIFNDPSPHCTSVDSYHRVKADSNGMTAEGVKNLLAASLTAATAQKPVSINFETNTGSCFVNRMQVVFN